VAKKKKDKPAFEAKTLEDFVAKSNEALGSNWLQTAAEATRLNSVKLWTGFYELDMMLYGGLPYGKFFEVFGEDSSGKSLLAVRFATQCLHTCRHCVTPILEFTNYETGEIKKTCMCGKCEPMNVIYVDSEDKLDYHWAHVNGWPKKNDPLAKHLYAGSPRSADFLSDMTRIAIKNKVLDVLIVDSWAALFPESREGRTAMEQQPGDHAKAIQNLLQAILHENIGNQHESTRKVTILGTNQVRSKIGAYGSNPETTPGGWFLKYIDVGKGRMMAPKTNDGIDKAKMTATGEHYVDFTMKLYKSAFGVGKGSTAEWRVYNRLYGDKQPGSTNEIVRMQNDLKSLGIVQKQTKGITFLGMHFDKVGDMLQVLDTPAMQWTVRGAIGHALATPETRSYIDLARYDYNPFYRLVMAGDDDGEDIPKYRLEKSESKVRKTRRKRKSDAIEQAIEKDKRREGAPVPPSDE